MSKKENTKKFGLALDKENYFLLIIAAVIVIIGFIFGIYAIMKKPKSDKKEE